MAWSKIPLPWVQELPRGEWEGFEQSLRNSKYVLDQLKRIIERELETLELDKEDDYNNPQWPVLRADRNGKQKSLRFIHKLLP